MRKLNINPPTIFLTTLVRDENFKFLFGKKSDEFNDFFYLPDGAFEEFFERKEFLIVEYSDALLAYGGHLHGTTWLKSINLMLEEINYLTRFDLPIVVLTEEQYLPELIPIIQDHYEKMGVEIYDVRFYDKLWHGLVLPKDMYGFFSFGDEIDQAGNRSEPQGKDCVTESENSEVKKELVMPYYIAPFIEIDKAIQGDNYLESIASLQ
jgi:hypothetical protein